MDSQFEILVEEQDQIADDDYVPQKPTIAELMQASADRKAGRIKGKPWREVLEGADGVHR
jgi:hypothetical protein